jgi:hypothetical protein
VHETVGVGAVCMMVGVHSNLVEWHVLSARGAQGARLFDIVYHRALLGVPALRDLGAAAWRRIRSFRPPLHSTPARACECA